MQDKERVKEIMDELLAYDKKPKGDKIDFVQKVDLKHPKQDGVVSVPIYILKGTDYI